MHRRVALLVLSATGMPILFAQPSLHLKARASSVLLAESISAPPRESKRLTPGRRYQILQYETPPNALDLAELGNRGARIVQYVPDQALMVNAPDDFQPPAWVVLSDALQSSDKWSPDLDAQPLVAELTKPGEESGRRRALVEFFPDVSEADGRQIATIEGLGFVEHPDVTRLHLVVEGTGAQLRELTHWEEVAYVAPASEELASGLPVHNCAGAITELGSIGLYVAKIGEGWDGSGLNAAQLRYRIGAITSKLPAQDVVREIERALAEWSKVVKIDFSPATRAGDSRQIDVIFTKGPHGDAYPFDGPGRVLAHTFYPAPPNPEPLAGDLHLDDDESWRIGNDIDLYSVVLHELGHALGLGHSDKPNAVMYAYYQRLKGLTAEDIDAIRGLYAARNAASPTPSTPPTPTPTPAPPPATPPSTPPPTTPAPTNPDRTPPALTITSPSSSSVLTTASSIRLTGRATDNVGVAKVTCSSNVRGTVTAAGTANWSADIALAIGYNNLMVRAYDAAGNSTWRTVVVTRK